MLLALPTCSSDLSLPLLQRKGKPSRAGVLYVRGPVLKYRSRLVRLGWDRPGLKGLTRTVRCGESEQKASGKALPCVGTLA